MWLAIELPIPGGRGQGEGARATVVAGPTQVGDMLIFAAVADPAGATFALLKGLQPGPQA